MPNRLMRYGVVGFISISMTKIKGFFVLLQLDIVPVILIVGILDTN